MTSVLPLRLVHLSSVFTGTRATERRAVSRVCPLNPERERELSPPSPRGERRGEEKDPAGAQGRSLLRSPGQRSAGFLALPLPGAPSGELWAPVRAAAAAQVSASCSDGACRREVGAPAMRRLSENGGVTWRFINAVLFCFVFLESWFFHLTWAAFVDV